MIRTRRVSRETPQLRRIRAGSILRSLKRLYPDATCALRHDNALQLLVATILSAQSTDETVNRLASPLFARYATAEDFADAPIEDLERAIHSSGFFRQKAKNIKAACRILTDRFGGQVPDRMEALLELPGVARKTANVLLGTWFKKNEGVVVDTHVGRVSTRLALTWRGKDTKDAVRIENDLQEMIPRKDWTFFSHAVIWHGRRVCSASKPRCTECKLAANCPSAGTFG